jgi:glycosyltransferase involved in cell wall biosynthesis
MRQFLFDATPYAADNVTGAGRIVYHLIEQLAALDRENSYLVFGFAQQIWPPGLLPDNFTYRRLTPRRWLGPLAMEVARRWFVERHALNHRVDLLHCTLEMVPLYEERARVLFSLYDLARWSPHFLYSAPGSLRTMIRTRLRYSLARRADMLHTISEFSADEIARQLKIDRRRIRVIYPGCHPIFSPGPPDLETLRRHRLHDVRYLLFVGEFGRQKNEEGLLRAYFMARAEHGLASEVKLALVGDASKLKESTRLLLAHHEFGADVRFLGRVPDGELLHLYRGAVALALPSYYEGFGLPVLEAMTCATPPVVSRATSLPEVVGDAGLLVTPGKVAELAEALGRLAGDDELRRELSARALERSRRFTFAAMAKAQHDLYVEMIDG